MTSPHKVDIIDYETMFKRHVHDNLILNDDLRLLDSMKRSKLKELNRDKAAFKKRLLPKTSYTRTRKRGTLPDIHFCRKETPLPLPKPSYVVCKDSPCSMKTWSHLTDVCGTKIDVYKTNVLMSDEAPLSYRKPVTKSSEDLSKAEGQDASKTAGDIIKRPSTSGYTKLPKSPRAPRDVHTSANNYKENLQPFNLPEFRTRAATMPEYSLRPSKSAKKPVLTPTLLPRADANVTKKPLDAANNGSEGNLNSSKEPTSVEIRVISPIEETVSVNTSSEVDNINTPTCKLQRAKSFNSAIKRKDSFDATTFRRRSQTIDSGRLLKRRGTISVAELGTLGLRRMALLNKLRDLDNYYSDHGSEDLDSSYESLGTCRYLRLPGQSIHGSQEDVSLENLQLTEEAH